MNIRLLNPNEIDCRVQTAKENGCSLLLYKDARCDMKILDEAFGTMNWKRSHQLINGNLFCTVEIWDEVKNMWISKQDVGTESYTEKEKGQSSDSFKRACFNIGIGRELYTAPFIWINLAKDEVYKKKDNYGVKTKFSVLDIGYNEDREINKLTIIDNKNKVRYELGKNAKNKPQSSPNGKKTEGATKTIDDAKVKALRVLADQKGVSENYIAGFKKKKTFEQFNMDEFMGAKEWLEKKEDKH